MKAPADGARSYLATWAHLAVLWSFAVAQPLFDILSDSPEFFVARENTAGDIVVLALAVTIVPPTLLLLIELLLVRVPRVREAVHLAFIGILVAAIALQALKDLIGGSAAVLIALALALGAAGALAYARLRAAPAVLSVLSPAPLLFVILFLFFSPVTDLVLPKEEGASQGSGATQARVPIVMVVFDEFSGASLMDAGGRLDSTRYPNFARLARDATWYRNATTVADYTSDAMPAVLTGVRPEKEQLPIRADHPDSLFTYLGDDYAFNVEEQSTALCPADLCRSERRAPAGERLRELVSDLNIVLLHRLLPDDLGADLPAVDQTFSGFGDGGAATTAAADDLLGRPEAFQRFLSRIGSHPRRPTLDLIHSDLPHVPWNYLPSGQEYVTDSTGVPGTSRDEWGTDTRLITQGQQRYLLQVGYSDTLLGRLLDRLRATGRYDRSLVIVTADHGVAFQPELSRRAISDPTFEQIADVPLFIKAPGQHQGVIDESAARSVDILPTIADHLGSPLTWRSDGHSLRDPAGATDDPLLVFAKYGPAFTLPFPEFKRRRDALVDRVAGTFGARDHHRGVFAPGEDLSLVGRAVGRMPSAPPVDAQAELDDPRVLAAVDTKAQVLPVYLGGALTGLGPSQRIAVALNGRIAAVTRSYASFGTTRFAAIVDPDRIRAGANTIALFELQGRHGAWRLAPLGQVAHTYELAGGPKSQELVDSSGRRVPVVPGAVYGFVEQAEVDEGTLRMFGWAASKQSGAAKRVVVFAGDRFLIASRPTTPRPDVAQDHGPRSLLSGFAVVKALERAEDDADFRVFAVGGGKATELPRLKPRP